MSALIDVFDYAHSRKKIQETLTKIIGLACLALAGVEFYWAFTSDDYSAQFYIIKGLLFVIVVVLCAMIEMMQQLKDRLDQWQGSPSSKSPSETR